MIASGATSRQVKALVDEVEGRLRLDERKPLRREGIEESQWVLLDYGDVIIHVFDAQTRAYYELERLWGDAPRLDAGLSKQEQVAEA